MRILFLGLLLAGCATAPEQGATVYERYTARAADPAFMARMEEPAKKIEEMAWMVGEWRTAITVFAAGNEAESTSEDTTIFRRVGDSIIASDDLSTILAWDAFAQRWVTFGSEPPAAALTSSTGTGDGSRLVFEGPVTLFGERFVLRQTMFRENPDSFGILNEQKMPDGSYRKVDAYAYHRISR
jgi:hypothetical protein